VRRSGRCGDLGLQRDLGGVARSGQCGAIWAVRRDLGGVGLDLVGFGDRMVGGGGIWVLGCLAR
jgi:hypothetical protein